MDLVSFAADRSLDVFSTLPSRQSEEHRLVLGIRDLQWQGDDGDVVSDVVRLNPAVAVLFLKPCDVRMIGWTEKYYQQHLRTVYQCIVRVYPNVSHILDSSSGRMS